EYDMIVSPLSPNSPRYMAVDLSEFLWAGWVTTIHRKAQVQPDIAGFIKPFSATTWLSVLATFVAFVICFIMTFKMREILSPKASSKRGQHRLSSRDARISVFAVLKILLNQPQENDERSPLMRLLLMTTMLWGFLLSTFYKTFLTSMLVLPRVVEPFNTLEELVTKRTMPHMLSPGSSLS
ncbi:Ionotropic receptor 160, partial [Hyalella azteca]